MTAPPPVRTGWAEAAQAIAEAGDDAPVWDEFGNAEDADLTWQEAATPSSAAGSG